MITICFRPLVVVNVAGENEPEIVDEFHIQNKAGFVLSLDRQEAVSAALTILEYAFMRHEDDCCEMCGSNMAIERSINLRKELGDWPPLRG